MSQAFQRYNTMVETFARQNGSQVAEADRKQVRTGDIMEPTVHEGEWSEIFVEASTNTKRYAPGYGTGNRQSSNAGYSDFDLQNSAGAGIEGDFRWVLYESEDHDVPLYISQPISANAQRNSVTESLTDKQLYPGRIPVGSQDRELVLEFKADAESDGDDVSASNSTADSGLPYSMFRK